MKSKRGFAAMSAEMQRLIASRGGKAAHAAGTAHEFNSEEASRAGKKGGKKVSKDRDHMAEIGRKGGLAAQANGTAHKYTSDEAKAARKKKGNGN